MNSKQLILVMCGIIAIFAGMQLVGYCLRVLDAVEDTSSWLYFIRLISPTLLYWAFGISWLIINIKLGRKHYIPSAIFLVILTGAIGIVMIISQLEDFSMFFTSKFNNP